MEEEIMSIILKGIRINPSKIYYSKVLKVKGSIVKVSILMLHLLLKEI